MEFEIKKGVLEKYHKIKGKTEVVIPDSVTKIGELAFKGCESLASVTIPNSVTEIEWRAFEGCTSLASVTIPGSVTKIGEVAFEGCTSLASVTIPDSVTGIGNYAFYGCKKIKFTVTPQNIAFAFDCSKYELTADLFKMLKYKDFSVKLPPEIKIPAILSFYLNNNKDADAAAYIQKKSFDFMKLAIDNEGIKGVEELLSENLISKNGLDKAIAYAIEKKQTEIQVVLTHYKSEKFGFKDIDKER